MLVSWNITRACNLKCEHCYRDAGKVAPGELSFEEGRSLLRDLKSLNFRILIFSGGEPLLRPDLFELIKFAKSLGLISVLGTNGTLIDASCAEKLKVAGLKRAGISLDSVDSKIHDKFRACAGAWEKAVAGIKNCRKAGLEVQLHTTVTKKNISEVLKITDFAADLGACAHHIFFLVPTGRGRKIDSVMCAPQEYEALLHKIMEKQNSVSLELKPVCAPHFLRIARQKKIKLRFEKGCLAGISYACILPDGEVHRCPYLPLALGNVKKEGFVKIWQESEVFHKLRRADLGGKCGRCEFKPICSGCRAAAFYQSGGDYLAEDLNCSYEPKMQADFKSTAV
ncbi:MAG: radical SAM protein [Candidatus Omnitrophica bacterium]|nr:radical SAM protein [Candidatus Omnitrophota bacterium]